MAALLVLTLAPSATAADQLTISAAERKEVTLLNEQRAKLGLRPVRIDSRLMAIARGRSTDMVTRNYFAHQTPEGDWAWDFMNQMKITWYGAGEILALNYWASLAESAVSAAHQWRNSPSHYAIIKTPDYNYVGVGLAIAGGKRVWTAIFMKGPDRTGAWAKMYWTGVNDLATSSTTRRVTVKWRGADVPLASLTSGFRYFQVQRRIKGGTWQTVLSSWPYTWKTWTLYRKYVYEVRVRARDKAGNWGAWSAPMVVDP